MSFTTVLDRLASWVDIDRTDFDLTTEPRIRRKLAKLGTGVGRLAANRRLLGLILGPTVFVLVVQDGFDLTGQQARLLGLLLATVIFWVLEVFPMALTAVLAMAMAVMLQVAPAEQVFGAFSSPTLFLLLGSFILTAAMTKHRLAERLSLEFLLIRGVAGSTRRIVIAFGAMAALMSTVLDNGAVAAILLPIAIGLTRTFGRQLAEVSGPGPSRFLIAMLLMIAYGSTVGALMTPLGDASNLVAWDYIQQRSGAPVSIGTWVAMAAPTCVVLFAVLCIVVIVLNRPELREISGTRRTIRPQLAAMGSMTRGEKNTLWVFCGACVFWMLPSVAAAALGQDAAAHAFLIERMPPSVVAVIAACVLFILPAEQGRFTMTWRDTNAMNWGPLLLVGATLAMGTLMADSGLAGEMGTRLARLAEGLDATGVNLFAAATAILFSEITTNLVSVTVVVPLIPPVAESSGGDPLLATWIATFAAIYGFILPISTSANAIVYGSGHVPLWRMARTGLFVDLSGIVLVVAGVTVMAAVLGIA
ncbi:MAG: DASS family sodium-coupled anion symporter [Alphaproteobacteria bacterium]|jgi:sodium-dependent dicarboxylate transporter 2/3/5|nr:DASS family sodium-coupled anion symporter [Alphaproteobacteria bacterium]